MGILFRRVTTDRQLQYAGRQAQQRTAGAPRPDGRADLRGNPGACPGDAAGGNAGETFPDGTAEGGAPGAWGKAGRASRAGKGKVAYGAEI